jgi:hypothetical protein
MLAKVNRLPEGVILKQDLSPTLIQNGGILILVERGQGIDSANYNGL